MGTKKLMILIMLIPVLLCTCEKRVTYHESEPADYPTITWVGTDVIYDPYAVKQDLSLIVFMNDNDDECKKFNSQTLTDTAVVRIINESFNIARIDPLADTLVIYYGTPTSCSHLASSIYNITTLPTTCLLDANGAYLNRWTGFIMPNTFADYLEYARNHY